MKHLSKLGIKSIFFSYLGPHNNQRPLRSSAFFSKIIFFGTVTFIILAVEIIIRKNLTVFTIGAFEARKQNTVPYKRNFIEHHGKKTPVTSFHFSRLAKKARIPFFIETL